MALAPLDWAAFDDSAMAIVMLCCVGVCSQTVMYHDMLVDCASSPVQETRRVSQSPARREHEGMKFKHPARILLRHNQLTSDTLRRCDIFHLRFMLSSCTLNAVLSSNNPLGISHVIQPTSFGSCSRNLCFLLPPLSPASVDTMTTI